ncbi:MAG: SHOCT domain-containing protein [Actinomycetota bacterium]
MDWGEGWWLVMMVGMVIFWAFVVLGIVWLVREVTGRRDSTQHEADPLETLDHRLADGTISVEDYRERKAILGGSRDSEQRGDR